jgi:hypothetical protein
LGPPLYGNLLEHVAADVEDRGPSWEILQGHERDPSGSALALRLMGAVNRLVLAGEEPAPGRTTVLFHSIVEQYLSEGELTSFHRSVDEAGRRATPAAPLAWLRMEPNGDRAAVRLTLWPGGEDRLLARSGYHGTPVELLT